MLYNKRLRKGFLYDKLRYLDRSRKQHPNVEDDVDEESSQTPESTEADLLSYLKTCVVKNQSNELKQKLTESVSVRWKYLKRGMVEIKLMFPFYFADPRLVSIFHFSTCFTILSNFTHSRFYSILISFTSTHIRLRCLVMFGTN